jgi:uncharacterized membrane protein
VQYYQLVGIAACIRDTWAIPEITNKRREKLTMMGGSGFGMGVFGLLAMGVFLLVLVGLVVWLVARPRDRS